LDAEPEPGHLPTTSLRHLPPRRSSAREVLFQNIHFSYKTGREVLHGINLTIPAGTSLALVGPTGAGKTTLASLVARFHDPTQGQVLLDGTPLPQISLDELRREVGVVTQEPFLFQATIRENLERGKPGAPEQEIEKVLPEVVMTDTSPEQTKSVTYGNITAELIEAIKELTQRLESLEKLMVMK
jgi:ATP-binding cassette subfamily B protein